MDKVLNDANEATMRMRGGRWKKMDELSARYLSAVCEEKGRERRLAGKLQGQCGWRAWLSTCRYM